MKCWDKSLKETLEVAFHPSDSPKAHTNPCRLNQAVAKWKENLRYMWGGWILEWLVHSLASLRLPKRLTSNIRWRWRSSTQKGVSYRYESALQDHNLIGTVIDTTRIPVGKFKKGGKKGQIDQISARRRTFARLSSQSGVIPQQVSNRVWTTPLSSSEFTNQFKRLTILTSMKIRLNGVEIGRLGRK